MSKDVNKIFEEISNLSINDTLSIIEKFYEKFPSLKSLSSIGGNNQISNNSSENKKEKKEENKVKKVILVSYDSSPVNKAKVIMIVSKLQGKTPLVAQKELKDLPFVLKENANEESFNKIKDEFKDLKVELKFE